MPRRVSEQERQQILEELLAICRDADIALVVIHPAYRGSQRHECVLTGFCRARGVPMFEAFDVLHPEGRPAGALYLDKAHPTPEGHRRLATGLGRTLGDGIRAAPRLTELATTPPKPSPKKIGHPSVDGCPEPERNPVRVSAAPPRKLLSH